MMRLELEPATSWLCLMHHVIMIAGPEAVESRSRGRAGPDRTPAAPPRRTTEVTGRKMPTARAIIGHNSGGSVAVNTKCYACCKALEKEGEDHRAWECPAKFASEHPGRSMPGFDEKGEHRPSAWAGDEITQETGQQWSRMQAMGFLTVLHDDRQGQRPSGARP